MRKPWPLRPHQIEVFDDGRHIESLGKWPNRYAYTETTLLYCWESNSWYGMDLIPAWDLRILPAYKAALLLLSRPT